MHEGYNRFTIFLKTFERANNFKYELENNDNKYYRFLVFIYNINKPEKEPIIYSLINRAIKVLQISHSALLDYIFNNYIYKSNFILSFELIALKTFGKYTIKLAEDNQLRKHVIVYNQVNEVVAE